MMGSKKGKQIITSGGEMFFSTLTLQKKICFYQLFFVHINIDNYAFYIDQYTIKAF